jgi:nitrogen fixation/metabolism regulation signal transduction histidine kinase
MSIIENFSLVSFVLCIFLAIVIGLYVGNLLKNRRREKGYHFIKGGLICLTKTSLLKGKIM